MSPELKRTITINKVTQTTKIHWAITTAVIFVGAILLMSLSTIFFYYRHTKRQRYENRCRYFEDLEKKAQKNFDCMGPNDIIQSCVKEHDKWEINHDQVVLQSVLGEGAFGLVRKGWLKDSHGNPTNKVAVKMLKDCPNVEHIKQFLLEIEIMKSVGPHPHLVSIIGCCTQPGVGKNMLLVVEYCGLGDLQNYLRKIWDKMTGSRPMNQLVNNSCSPTIIVNKLYELNGSLEVDEPNNDIKPSDLLSFARQICIAMEFLASMRVIHRDLAARNVLVCDNKSVKVADFGLSRDVYQDNVYRKVGNGKLPIRWMAIESLTHQVYTSQSDVWSFGVLLWEIITLGGNPYPSIPTNSLLKNLRSGYRMERPFNCSQELYALMTSCWRSRPKDRPTFTALRKSLDKILESMTTATYLDLDILASSYFIANRVPQKDSTFSIIPNPGEDDFLTERYVQPFSVMNPKTATHFN